MSLSRLKDERKHVRQNPIYGFAAKPRTFSDGSTNFYSWDCIVPGREDTPWAGGRLYLRMMFTEYFPNDPPRCMFTPPLFHPNVDMYGNISLPMLTKNGWDPNTRILDILLKIQDLIHEPNMRATTNLNASYYYRYYQESYIIRVRNQAHLLSRT